MKCKFILYFSERKAPIEETVEFESETEFKYVVGVLKGHMASTYRFIYSIGRLVFDTSKLVAWSVEEV